MANLLLRKYLRQRGASTLLRLRARSASSSSSGGADPVARSKLPKGGPGLEHFLAGSSGQFGGGASPRADWLRRRRTPVEDHPYLTDDLLRGDGVSVYLDVHGCQMNVNDTEVVWSILEGRGYQRTLDPGQADIWLVVTCSIREGAEAKIWRKLHNIRSRQRRGGSHQATGPRSLPDPESTGGPAPSPGSNARDEARRWREASYKPDLKVGILGCMAERLKGRLLDERAAGGKGRALVDVVAGPDSYRDLPRLLAIVRHLPPPGDLQDDGGGGAKAKTGTHSKGMTRNTAINVLLSIDETYADITPSRLDPDSVAGFVSIQRGCDNNCSYCIVPLTRGRERSRPVATILDQVRRLVDAGVKDVTLLGQNVNSYCDADVVVHAEAADDVEYRYAPGFQSRYRPRQAGLRFAELLRQVAGVDPELRIRFTSPHPKDFPEEVLDAVAETPNVCKQLHLPAQCGSDRILAAMRRGYTREAYIDLVERAKARIPGLHISGDLICGFCGETEEDFQQTLDLIREVGYSTLFMFPYSVREKTPAELKLVDDVPQEVKLERMDRMSRLFRELAQERNRNLIGSRQLVLVEGDSKRSKDDLQGRCDGNIRVIFPKTGQVGSSLKPGDYCVVQVEDATSQVLKGLSVEATTLVAFHRNRVEDSGRSSAIDNSVLSGKQI